MDYINILFLLQKTEGGDNYMKNVLEELMNSEKERTINKTEEKVASNVIKTWALWGGY